jgi:hexosaminidase
MTPTSHVYLDYYQGPRATEPLAIGGFTPLDKVYAFEPVPPELTLDEARHVLGAQGNVWTEYMKTTDHVEYMALPRMLALSEVVWSPREARDYARFLSRLAPQLARLDALGARYRPLDAAPLRSPGGR